MRASTRPCRAYALAVLVLSAGFLAACSSSGTKPMTAKKPRSKEYFAESEYGVKASPRVSNLRTNLPRGGGRDQVGKPYQVRGKWYYPKEDRNYKKTGAASWYGDAFHGRLTANGEIYDMTHLTAAHPTMPLPSYARVTNTENGNSVIVRVNDRGPYAHGRVIDLSRKAAEMLDYTHVGIAKVKVEYVGRAPLDGRDDQYLLASYRPGGGFPDPSDGMPSGVMVAMNGPTPSESGATMPFPGDMTEQPAVGYAGESSTLALPDVAPVAMPRPDAEIALATMGYASDEPRQRLAALAAVDRLASSQETGEYIAAGSFAQPGAAQALAEKLADLGRVDMVSAQAEGQTWQTVNLYADGRYGLDDMLRAAWARGADDALTVHD